MDRAEAIKELRNLRASREELIVGVRKKRSWLPSERAMAIANHNQHIRALDFAINALEFMRVPIEPVQGPFVPDDLSEQKDEKSS